MHKEITDVKRTHYVTIPTDIKTTLYSFNPGLEGDGYNCTGMILCACSTFAPDISTFIFVVVIVFFSNR